MRVAQPIPATWRGRNLTTETTRLDLHARAVAAMRRATEGATNMFEKMRSLSLGVLARIHKARSLTQTPSALERLWEELVALRLAGVPDHQLRIVAVETQHLIDDMASDTIETPQTVLTAMLEANEAAAREQLAESMLTHRADREVTIGDLDRLAEHTKANIAAQKHQLLKVTRLRRHLAISRHGFGVVRGGQS